MRRIRRLVCRIHLAHIGAHRQASELRNHNEYFHKSFAYSALITRARLYDDSASSTMCVATFTSPHKLSRDHIRRFIHIGHSAESDFFSIFWKWRREIKLRNVRSLMFVHGSGCKWTLRQDYRFFFRLRSHILITGKTWKGCCCCFFFIRSLTWVCLP